MEVDLGGPVISALAVGSKVRGFKPGRGRLIFNGTAYFGGEVKTLVPSRKILRHVKKPYEYDRDTSKAKSTVISFQASPSTLPDISVGYCQRALVDESEMFRTQMGTHNRS
jgi:hypothetical protein